MKKNFLSIREFIGNFPWILAERVFLVILLLILLSLAIGGCLFYKYVTYAQSKNFESGTAPLKFKYEFYEKVLAGWDENKKELEESLQQSSKSPFKTPWKEIILWYYFLYNNKFQVITLWKRQKRKF